MFDQLPGQLRLPMSDGGEGNQKVVLDGGLASEVFSS